MNALSAMEREDELVSLSLPPLFGFPFVAKQSIVVPHSAATTPAAVSTSRISMPWWSTLRSAMSSSSTRAPSWPRVRLIPPIIRPLPPTPSLTHTPLNFLGHMNTTSNLSCNSNSTTTNIHTNRVHSTQMTWSSTWTHLPLPHPLPLPPSHR